jgi:hypothetical protein
MNFWKISPWLSRLIILAVAALFSMISMKYVFDPRTAAAASGITIEPRSFSSSACTARHKTIPLPKAQAANLGSRVTISTLKVGAVRTNIRKQFPLWMKIAVPLLIDPILTVTPGAIAASARDLLLKPEFEGQSGALFTQIRRMKATPPGRRTVDPLQGRRLWEFSEALVAGALATHTTGEQPG